jgi:streptogramin lyase
MLALLAGSADARLVKGNGPSTIAVGYGAVWIGFGDGVVTRVDARTLRQISRRIAGGFITSIDTGVGSVWVAPSGASVRRVDPRTGAVHATIANQPGTWSGSTQVAVGAGSVWVADSGRDAIFRVNARRNQVSRRRGLPHRLRSIAVGTRGVWVQTFPAGGPMIGPEGPRIVSRLDPGTLRLRRAFRLRCDAILLPRGSSLWVLDNCDGSLRRFDSRAGTLSRPIASPGAMGLSAGFGSIWVSDGSMVRRVQDGRVVAEIQARGLVAAGEGFVWLLDYGDGVVGWLRRIDPATNRLVGRAIRLASAPK